MNPPLSKTAIRTMTRVLVFVGLLILLSLGLYMAFSTKVPQPAPGDREVRLQASPSDGRLTDVYLLDPKTGIQTKALTLSGIDRQRVHQAEFFKGNVYLVKAGAGDGTVELWKYDAAGDGTKLYAAAGIDFRVSQEAGAIGLVAGTFPTETVAVLDSNGTVTKSLTRADLGIDPSSALEPIAWRQGAFWLDTKQGIQLIDLILLKIGDWSYSKHDLSGLHITGHEFAVAPASARLVFSTFVSPVDVKDVKNPPMQSASLYLYDIATKATTKLATVPTGRPLEPSWESEGVVDYADPAGGGRVRLTL